MNPDISEAMGGWNFEPGAITVRKIIGEDGRPKVQMRLELGLIQMEMTGRPDGSRPHERESYLHFYKEKFQKHWRKHETEKGFSLSTEAAEQLRIEALHYYYRYLSLFHLNEFEQVAKDTARNLEVAELLKRFAQNDEDRFSVEQYRPYILMMNSQARARLAMQKGALADALGIVRTGIRNIRKFLEESLQEVEEREGKEIGLLEQLEKEIIARLPANSLEKLKVELEEAVAKEEFEKASSLRDCIRALEVKGNCG